MCRCVEPPFGGCFVVGCSYLVHVWQSDRALQRGPTNDGRGAGRKETMGAISLRLVAFALRISS